MKPLMLELFSGSGNMAAAFRKAGYRTLTIDLFEAADLQADIKELSPETIIKELGGRPTVIWASPPCQAFSVAAISKNFKERKPESSRAFEGIELLSHTLRLIMALQPRLWYIENPRGMMRTLPIMAALPRRTLTFCQYGDRAMKPTDVWTNNLLWWPKSCKPGASCHQAAKRGSKTGTQGKKGAKERGILPYKLCEEIAGY